MIEHVEHLADEYDQGIDPTAYAAKIFAKEMIDKLKETMRQYGESRRLDTIKQENAAKDLLMDILGTRLVYPSSKSWFSGTE